MNSYRFQYVATTRRIPINIEFVCSNKLEDTYINVHFMSRAFFFNNITSIGTYGTDWPCILHCRMHDCMQTAVEIRKCQKVQLLGGARFSKIEWYERGIPSLPAAQRTATSTWFNRKEHAHTREGLSNGLGWDHAFCIIRLQSLPIMFVVHYPHHRPWSKLKMERRRRRRKCNY